MWSVTVVVVIVVRKWVWWWWWLHRLTLICVFLGSLLLDKSSLSSLCPVQQSIFCSGSFSRAHRIAPVQILHADTNQTNDCMQIRASEGGEELKPIFSSCHIHILWYIQGINLLCRVSNHGSVPRKTLCFSWTSTLASHRSNEWNHIENPLWQFNCQGMRAMPP